MITNNAALSDHKSRPSEILETLQSLDPFLLSKWLLHKQYPVGCYFHRLLKRILLSHRVLSWETRSFQKIVLKAKTSIYKSIVYPLIYLSLKKQLNNIVNSLQNWHFNIPLFLNIRQRKSILTCNLIKSKKINVDRNEDHEKNKSINTQFKVFFWHAQPRFYHLHGKIIIKQVDLQFKKGSMATKRDNE